MRRQPNQTPESLDPVDFYAARRWAASTTANKEYDWRSYVRWCAANRVPYLPARSRHVVDFMHSQREFWGPARMRMVADTISDAHRALGYADPTDGEVRHYLVAAARAFAGGEEPRPVDAIPIAELDKLCSAPSSAALSQRASSARQAIALIASREHGLSWRQLGGAAVSATQDSVWLDLPQGGRIEITGAYLPEALAAAAELRGQKIRRLPAPDHLAALLKASARRAGMAVIVTAQLATALDDSAFEWMLGWTDVRFATDLRNRTIVVVGIALARRGIEMGQFDYRDFKEDPHGEGWRVRIRKSKTDVEGRGIDHFLAHSDHDSDGCGWCPACALAAWRFVLERRWGLTSGPLFPNLHGSVSRTPSRRLKTHDIRRIVIEVWRNGGGDPMARIASRTLRVSGATAASQAGMASQAIADLITKQDCVDSVGYYIRTPGGLASQYHLPL